MRKNVKVILSVMGVLIVVTLLSISYFEFKKAHAIDQATELVRESVNDIFSENESVKQRESGDKNLSIDNTEEETTVKLAPNKEKVGVGETVTSEKFNIALLNFTTTNKVFEDSYSYYEADEGMIFVIAVFRIENLTQGNETIWPASDFEYYADNVLCDGCKLGIVPPNINGYPDISSDDELKPGRVIEGYVACEVPVASKILEIEYEGFIFECELTEM